jgi:transglutaminase-like putative cysteine protease
MKISYSKELQIKMQRDKMYFTVMEYTRDLIYIPQIARYYYDWRYADTKENLSLWLKDLPLPDKCKKEIDNMYLSANDKGMKELLTYVKNKIKYTPDSDSWKCAEVWQTPEQTYTLRKGDCEDGALLLYKCAKYVGFTDSQLYLVAGSVEGGGHCYVKYVSEDGLNYPMDWCYWYSSSVLMNVMYEDNPNYFNGEREWFIFNESGGYVSK